MVEGGWFIRGDLNEVLYSGDQNGGVGSTSQMEKFHSWVYDFTLFNFPLQTGPFTGSDFRANVACSKLDHFFAFPQWLENFSGTSLKGLPRPISDHCHYYWTQNGRELAPPPSYLKTCGYYTNLLRMWSKRMGKPPPGTLGRIQLQQKLKTLKDYLKNWNKTTFGKVSQQKEDSLANYGVI